MQTLFQHLLNQWLLVLLLNVAMAMNRHIHSIGLLDQAHVRVQLADKEFNFD